MRLHVTEHALQRARQRYGLVRIDATVIRDDVTSALFAGRGGKTIPGTDQRPPSGNAIYAWTPCLGRVYVVEGVRSRRGPFLRVVTSLPSRRDAVEDFRRAA